MSRYTYKSLTSDALTFSRYAAEHGLPFRFVAGHRNGYTAVDLYVIGADGAGACLRNIGTGSPRECYTAIRDEYQGLLLRGPGNPHRPKPTRKQAKAVLSLIVDYTEDFHALPYGAADTLATWAKLTRYRKPANANGSTARYFFHHLKTKH